MEESKSIKSITLTYEDESKRIINKGFIANIGEPDVDGGIGITFSFANISGVELQTIVEAVVKLGFNLGMFGNNSDEN